MGYNHEYLQFVSDNIFFDEERGNLFDIYVQEFYRRTDNLVNEVTFSPEKYISEIMKDTYLRCIFLHIALEWIHVHAHTMRAWKYERNEVAMRRILEIVDMPEFQKWYAMYFTNSDYSYIGKRKGTFPPSYEGMAKCFCLHAATMHRTLMQTFTGFLFCFINQYNGEEAKGITRKMSAQYGEYWYSLPFV